MVYQEILLLDEMCYEKEESVKLLLDSSLFLKESALLKDEWSFCEIGRKRKWDEYQGHTIYSIQHKQRITQVKPNITSKTCLFRKSNISEETETKLSSVYKQTSTLNNRNKSRKIAFAPDTKNFDGMRSDKFLYEEIMFKFFVEKQPFTAKDISAMTKKHGVELAAFLKLVDELIARMKSFKKCEEDDGVPVLVQGGRRGMKLLPTHSVYVETLRNVANRACKI